MTGLVESCIRRVEAGEAMARPDALALLAAARRDPWPVLAGADALRRRFRGRRVRLCGIAAVRVGRCGEDCRWCAQSSHWAANVPPQDMLPADELVRRALAAEAAGAHRFGLVSSGGRLCARDFAACLDAAGAIRRHTGLGLCASLGAITADQGRELAAAGVTRYHHNLETSERHFPAVCTTHTYAERVATARAAVEAGLQLCCGGLFGIGETDEDRVDLALAVRDLGATSAPLNFLHPIPGTPLADAPPLAPMDALAIVAMFRFMLPDRTIKVAGGREHALRDLQSLIFLAGADSCMIGDYLTTRGRRPEDDLRMIRDLGLDPDAPCAEAGQGDG
jgi:biotin synthase